MSDYQYKIQDVVSKRVEVLQDLILEIQEQMMEIGQANALGIISYMVDENFDYKDIKKQISDMLSGLNENSIMYYTEIKQKMYKENSL